MPTPAGAIEAQAWECAAGDVCVWDGTNGTGNPCAWDSDDPDWWSGSVQCSWSDERNPRSIRNNGVPATYDDVARYSGVNYTNFVGCMPRGGSDSSFNIRIRSHRWVASC